MLWFVQTCLFMFLDRWHCELIHFTCQMDGLITLLLMLMLDSSWITISFVGGGVLCSLLKYYVDGAFIHWQNNNWSLYHKTLCGRNLFCTFGIYTDSYWELLSLKSNFFNALLMLWFVQTCLFMFLDRWPCELIHFTCQMDGLITLLLMLMLDSSCITISGGTMLSTKVLCRWHIQSLQK